MQTEQEIKEWRRQLSFHQRIEMFQCFIIDQFQEYVRLYTEKFPYAEQPKDFREKLDVFIKTIENTQQKIRQSYNPDAPYCQWVEGDNPPLKGYYYVMVMKNGVIYTTIDYHKRRGKWENHRVVIKYANILPPPSKEE
jgi:hypothetical protein